MQNDLKIMKHVENCLKYSVKFESSRRILSQGHFFGALNKKVFFPTVKNLLFSVLFLNGQGDLYEVQKINRPIQIQILACRFLECLKLGFRFRLLCACFWSGLWNKNSALLISFIKEYMLDALPLKLHLRRDSFDVLFCSIQAELSGPIVSNFKKVVQSTDSLKIVYPSPTNVIEKSDQSRWHVENFSIKV